MELFRCYRWFAFFLYIIDFCIEKILDFLSVINLVYIKPIFSFLNSFYTTDLSLFLLICLYSDVLNGLLSIGMLVVIWNTGK